MDTYTESASPAPGAYLRRGDVPPARTDTVPREAPAHPARRAFPSLAMMALFAAGRVIAAAPESGCLLPLTIEVGVDVPDASGLTFLTNLIGNHPGYRLTWVGRQSDTLIDVNLVGDGLGGDCRRVADDLRNDSRILSVSDR
jgi:hypothetical protein